VVEAREHGVARSRALGQGMAYNEGCVPVCHFGVVIGCCLANDGLASLIVCVSFSIQLEDWGCIRCQRCAQARRWGAVNAPVPAFC
jgi:hypothetical protein